MTLFVELKEGINILEKNLIFEGWTMKNLNLSKEELISIVIPCYNEEKNIQHTLEEIYHFFESNHFLYEVIVVVEKSTDNTLELVKSVKNSKTVVIENSKKFGKGYSLKKGISIASGKYILICDADLPVDISKYFLSMYELIKKDSEVGAVYATALGIKTCRKERGFIRSIASLIFFILRQLLLQFPITDTQLGFKLFKAEILKELVHKINENGFLFDLILTDLILCQGYEIEEVNVKVVERKIKSSVSIREIVKAFFGFLKYVLFVRPRLLKNKFSFCDHRIDNKEIYREFSPRHY